MAGENVRVRIDKSSGAVKLSGMSLRFPGQPSGMGGFQSIEIKFKKLGPKVYEWVVAERHSGEVLSKVKAAKFDLSGSMLRSGFNSVPDRLTIQPTSTNKSDLIATIDIEDYLRGVLPMEMPPSWPEEALKAQAIAARTFALFRKAERERAKASFHLESTVMDQVFRHGAELSQAHQAKIESAVNETKGIVLRDRRSKPFAAYFHADCGGQTEIASRVWGSGAGTGQAVDSSCPTRSVWQAKLSKEEIGRRIAESDEKSVRFAKLKLASLTPLTKTESGRVDLMQAVWSDGSLSKVSGHEFRMAVGHEVIKSTRFEIASETPTEIQFKGSGFGHGVGLCQWGARHMAASGKTHEQILAHYYPAAAITALR